MISPYAGAAAGKAISANGRIAFATVRVRRKSQPPAQERRRTRRQGGPRRRGQPGLQVELGGQAIEATEQAGFGLSTAVGLLAAIVVLLLTFGSLIAMGLPIVTALFGLGTGLGLIALFTHVVDTPNFSSELAAMIGLGVGIDYALFILTRFREAYATPGPTFENSRESVVQAMDTAGRAVLFAGCTVVIALLGMMLLGVSFLYGVAISASIGVLLVMLALADAAARAAAPSAPASRGRAAERDVAPPRRRRSRVRRGRHRRESGAPDRCHRDQRRWHGGIVEGGMWLRWSARAAPTVEHRDRLGARDAGDRRSRDRAAAGLQRRLATTPRARRPTAPTSCSRRASARASTGRCWSWRRCPARACRAAGSEALDQPSVAGGNDMAVSNSCAQRSPPLPAWPRSPRRKLNPAGDVATITVYPHSSPQAYATTQLVERLRDNVIPPLAGAAPA